MSSFAPEVLFEIGRFPVTNTVVNTIFVDGFLIALAIISKSSIKYIPGKFQILIESFVGGFYDFVGGIAESKVADVFPVFMTFFLFIIVANLSGLIPGLGTLGINEKVIENGKTVTEFIPFNRPTTSDFNTTFALGVTSLAITNGYAIYRLGVVEYTSKFLAFIPFLISLIKLKPKKPNVNFKNPLEVFIAIITPIVLIFVGLLELISELVRAISLSFRLFGNIYAGEVVMNTVNGIFSFLLPIPFLLLETIAGGVQALVFSMLTMVFMIILSTPHHDEEGAKEVNH